ncbi:MAG TPA: OPT family oligopeptide transporter [Pirellulales bacterium]|jgi:uncharacterized oligopeptide transporter (OPT) family protein|nr:OPT family oligopeptide transporter [Pirellulales bacterium]
MKAESQPDAADAEPAGRAPPGAEAANALSPRAPPADDPAHRWLREVYQGDDARQLTPRAIVTGMLIGGVMSISNLYVGLKTGWGLGVTITACIIAFAVFKALEVVIPAYRRVPFTILENYTMSSAASAAGYMASAGLVSAFPALYLTTGRQLLWWELMVWSGCVASLGVFMAVPLKRQLINVEQLPFPSGIATAETLRSMHSSGAEAMSKAKSLLGAAIFGGVVGAWKKVGDIAAAFGGKEAAETYSKWPYQLPDGIPLAPGERPAGWLSKYTFGFEGSLIMVAAGAIMGIRVGASLLFGALIYWGVIGPWLINHQITDPGYGRHGVNYWTLWPSTAMMVTAGLLSFAMRWRTIVRALQNLVHAMSSAEGRRDPLSHVEVPASWFVAGTLIAGTACVLFGHFVFEITWYMGILAVLLSFVLSIVAARATGETDVTPIGAMGKITQLMYGVIAPSNVTTNLMTASITAGSASHSADLLTDLKSGYLLGGNPRKQLISQLFGVLAGTIVSVPVYLIVARPEKFESGELPAPAARVWQGMAELFKDGIQNLPEYAIEAAIIGGVLGILLALADEFLPANVRRWLPSATGLGIAGVVPAYNSLMMFLGAAAAWMLAKQRPALDAKYTVAVASGLIAGETLVAVGIILAIEGPGMVREIARSLGLAG